MVYIITHSKIRFDYLNPKPEDILLEDIAHALSQICRFTGHTSLPYFVAHHSVLVSRFVSPENALWGLLHDAPEAYLNDLSSPLKTIINGDYHKLEDSIMSVIANKFGLKGEMPDEVKIVDKMVGINELWSFIDPDYKEEGIVKLWDKLEAWPYRWAKGKFMQRFEELTT
jgi:5'-deoxynucleotidase YfbR-like HD superfamily hydrolase